MGSEELGNFQQK